MNFVIHLTLIYVCTYVLETNLSQELMLNSMQLVNNNKFFTVSMYVCTRKEANALVELVNTITELITTYTLTRHVYEGSAVLM